MREIQPVQRDFIQHPPRLPYGKLGGHIFAPNAYLRGNAFMELPANAKKGAARKSAKTNGFIAEYSGFSTMARFNFAHTAVI